MKLNPRHLILGSAVFVSAAIGVHLAQTVYPISSLLRSQKELHQNPYLFKNFRSSEESNAIGVKIGGESALISTYVFGGSDKVFVGKVVGLTPSQWTGGKSGPQTVEQWENTSQQVFHEVILKVDEPILGVTKGQQIKLFRTGSSPGKPAKIGKVAYVWSAEDNNDRNPIVGDLGIFFVVSKQPVNWDPRKSITTAKRVNIVTSYFSAQKSGHYLSPLPEDATLERCSSVKKAGVLQTKSTMSDWEINSAIQDPSKLCATRRLYTVTDVKQKLKEFELVRACLTRHMSAKYPLVYRGSRACDKERRLKQG